MTPSWDAEQWPWGHRPCVRVTLSEAFGKGVAGNFQLCDPVVLVGCHSRELCLREDEGLEVFLGVAGAVLARVHEDHVETGLITMHGVENDLQEGGSQVQGWS